MKFKHKGLQARSRETTLVVSGAIWSSASKSTSVGRGPVAVQHRHTPRISLPLTQERQGQWSMRVSGNWRWEPAPSLVRAGATLRRVPDGG